MNLTAEQLKGLSESQLSFLEMCEQLYRLRFTGRTVIDWHEGRANVLEVPSDAIRIPLDKRRLQGARS